MKLVLKNDSWNLYFREFYYLLFAANIQNQCRKPSFIYYLTNRQQLNKNDKVVHNTSKYTQGVKHYNKLIIYNFPMFIKCRHFVNEHPTSDIPHAEHPISRIFHIPNIPHPQHPASPKSHIQNIPHPEHPTSLTSHIPNIPHPEHPTTQISHILNIPHSKHPTSPTSHIFNIPRLQYPTSPISYKPNISYPQHTTSPTFHITRISSSLSTNFRIHARLSLNIHSTRFEFKTDGQQSKSNTHSFIA